MHSDECGATCGHESGYAWFIEELDDGLIFNSWIEMPRCGRTKQKAKESAEEMLTQRMMTEQSKTEIYQAFYSMENVIKFLPKTEYDMR
jgi:hypothetical protein